MSQQSPASMDQLPLQTHVAQQIRRDKLRIQGFQHPSSPKSHISSGHSKQAIPAYEECSAGYLQGYPGHIDQDNIKNVFPGHNIHMISSNNYNLPAASDSRVLPPQNTGHFHTQSPQRNPLVGTIHSGQSLTPNFDGQVNASKSGSWGSGGPQFGMMNNNAFLNLPSLTVNSNAMTADLFAASSIQTSSFGSNGREGSMATYFPGSSIQADTMQTLYLRNRGIVGYTDSLASGNMVLVNNTTGSSLATHNFSGNGQQQQHFVGITVPTASPSQHSSVGAIENSSTEQQSANSSLLTSRLEAHAYDSWQAGGNELTFLQTTDAASSNQSLCGQLNNSVSLGSLPVAERSQVRMRPPSMSSIEEEQSGILPSGLRLQLDPPTTATGQRQGLSLCLFPKHASTVQLPPFQNHSTELDINCPGIAQTASEDNSFRIDRDARDGMMGGGFSNSLQSPGVSKQIHSSYRGVTGFPNVLRGSKFLKAAQELLDEVVNLSKFGKSEPAKHHKSQTLFGTAADKWNTAKETSIKNGITDTSAGFLNSAEETNISHNTEISMAERRELQIKKAKLVAMLDEVDQKYKQYYQQMQIVVSSFETVTGFGTAKTYTSLALGTISRHFRCLRDAIVGQICASSKSLGEEDMAGNGKGETSRLRFVDQQLRQQRAFQQLGMIQQPAWRPQRGLPERAVSVLRAWLFEHFLHPYPKDADKHMLARQAGLTRSQVSNWFINARVRLWKPMVEEIYMEEIKEAELGHSSAEKDYKKSGDSKADTKSEEGSENSQNSEDQKHTKTTQLETDAEDVVCEQQNISVSSGLKSEHSPDMRYGRSQAFSIEGVSNDDVFHDVRDEGVTPGKFKKARSGIEGSTYQFSPNMSSIVGFKMEGSCQNDKFNDERHSSENYILVHSGMALADSGGSGCLNRYDGQEAFTPKFSGSGGVSLTLGLQHSDGLSLSGTQQRCISSEGRNHGLGNVSHDYCNISGTAAAHAANAYESINLEKRKRFATHLLQTL